MADPARYFQIVEFAPFEMNKLYAIRPSVRGVDVLKYYGTEKGPLFYWKPLRHIFGLTQDAPDWNGRIDQLPNNTYYLDDFSLNYPRNYEHTIVPMKKHHAEKAEEIATMTGTRAQGPATEDGKSARKAPDMVLPRDVSRHIAEFAGQGRRRKTRRTRRS